VIDDIVRLNVEPPLKRGDFQPAGLEPVIQFVGLLPRVRDADLDMLHPKPRQMLPRGILALRKAHIWHDNWLAVSEYFLWPL